MLRENKIEYGVASGERAIAKSMPQTVDSKFSIELNLV